MVTRAQQTATGTIMTGCGSHQKRNMPDTPPNYKRELIWEASGLSESHSQPDTSHTLRRSTMLKVSSQKTLYLALVLSILLGMFANVAVAQVTLPVTREYPKVCGMPSVIRHDHVHTSIVQRMEAATNRPNAN